MASFRNVVGDVAVENWWDNGYHQIAFSRGDKGFIAINNDDGNLNARLSVGVPPGRYCDIISGNLKSKWLYVIGLHNHIIFFQITGNNTCI